MLAAKARDGPRRGFDASRKTSRRVDVVQVRGLDHFVLRVRDLDVALSFYRDILGLPILFLDDFRKGRRPFVSARVGDQLIDLVPDPTYDPEEGLRKGGYLHCCVEVEDRLDELIPKLRAEGVNMVEEQPVERMGARGIGRSIYVTDADGYVVELKECAR
jgi:catechol 2,3-dioxygenase-like lactoylglutathione lyase family enzyme